MKRRFTQARMLLAIMCALPLQGLQAEGLWYGNIDYDVLDVKINNQSYYPQLLSLSAGRWLTRGIAVELQLGAGTKSSDKKDFDISVSGSQGLYVRWQSPSSSNGLQAFFLTGFSRVQLDGSIGSQSNYPGKEWFSGPAVGVGLHGKLPNSEHWGATVAYKHYFLEDQITTDSVNMGLRYDF